MYRLTLMLLIMSVFMVSLQAQDEEESENLLSLPQFGLLLKPADWQFLWDHPYAPAMQNDEGTLIVRLQSGDTLESPLTVEAVGDDPQDALEALNVDVIGEPRDLHFEHEEGMPLDALMVETRLDETTNRLIVLALPPYQENWYLITLDAPSAEWDKALMDADDILETFRYIPNAPLLRVVLGYSLPDGAVLRRHEMIALEVISQRLHQLDLEVPFTVHLLADQTVELGFYGGLRGIEDLTKWVSQVGFLELVDFTNVGSPHNAVDALVLTTGRAAWQAANLPANAPNGDVAEDVALVDPVTGGPFETIITSADFESALAAPSEFTGEWEFTGRIAADKQALIQTFTRDHIGETMAIVLDGHVLMVPVINSELSDALVLAGLFDEEEMRRFAVLVASGPLSVPMTVATIELLE